jgi:hypothetical protein
MSEKDVRRKEATVEEAERESPELNKVQAHPSLSRSSSSGHRARAQSRRDDHISVTDMEYVKSSCALSVLKSVHGHTQRNLKPRHLGELGRSSLYARLSCQAHPITLTLALNSYDRSRRVSQEPLAPVLSAEG